MNIILCVYGIVVNTFMCFAFAMFFRDILSSHRNFCILVVIFKQTALYQ